ncbi:MAG TPA: anthranilate synthase component I family protein [bacterium]
MLAGTPFLFRAGPLRGFVRALPACPDLARLVQAVPEREPVVWLDSARTHPVTGRWSMVGLDPWLTLQADGDRVELATSASTKRFRAHPLEALGSVLKRYRVPARARPEDKALGLMGWLSYDLNRWIERLPAPQAEPDPLPDLFWYGMRVVALADHLAGRGWILSLADPHLAPAQAGRLARASLERAEEALAGPAPEEPAGGGPAACEPTSTQAEFQDMVRRVLEDIAAGEIFQANVSQRFTASWPGGAWPLYRRLRRINPSPFACFLRGGPGGEVAVASCSPERLVRVQDDRVDTRPIAGTRPRGGSAQEDALREFELLLSEKERAEHIMLVDLARNDLGRVARPGTVAVNELMALEHYSHVIHIVSDVAARLKRGAGAVDVIRAVFPGGTITGCPKVRCMQILRELEPVPRGLYTGSLGWLGFDGSLDLNIAIRTMVLRARRLSFHVGAGIVADSDPEREYQETLDKGAALIAALEPSETDHAAAR